MYKYIFGPVPSRRLGVSLGVDLVKHKTCNLDCIYCECGHTTVHTVSRKEYVNIDEVFAEVRTVLDTGLKPDYITFSGAGEPTLNSGIGRLIEAIRGITEAKIAVITNGVALSMPEVRKSLLKADVIMPSLDSATPEGFLKINKPVQGINIYEVIDGIAQMKKEFKGEIWLEVFIIEGINDSDIEISALKKAIEKINPDKVQLNSLDRPPADEWVKKAGFDTLEKVKNGLGYMKTEIITKYKERSQINGYSGDMETLIMNMIEKRPCTIDDLISITGTTKQELNKYLDIFEKEGKIKSYIGERGVFIRKI